jgi:hypothetical protein
MEFYWEIYGIYGAETGMKPKKACHPEKVTSSFARWL